MTIASEIQRIQTNIANAYTACNNKGATMPATQDSDNLATTINSISVPASSYTYNVDFEDPDNIGAFIIDGAKVFKKTFEDHARIKVKNITIADLHNASSWEIQVKYRQIFWTPYLDYRNIFACGNVNHLGSDFQGFNCIFEGGGIKFFAGEGYSWDTVGGAFTSAYNNGCEYIMKVSYSNVDGYTWQIKNVSAGETTFTTLYSDPYQLTNIDAIDSSNTYIWLGNNMYNYNNNPTNGNQIEFDLAECYVKVDGVTTYLAVAN